MLNMIYSWFTRSKSHKGKLPAAKGNIPSKALGSVQLKDMICYLSLLEGGRPEDKLEWKIAYYALPFLLIY